MAPVATSTAVIPASRLHGHHDRPSRSAWGTIIWLASELMFFAALFACVLHDPLDVCPRLWSSGDDEEVNIPFSSVNTTILVLSSLTCQLGVFAAERGQVGRAWKLSSNIRGWGLRQWFILTYIMGAIFIGGQALEFTVSSHGGHHLLGVRLCSTSPPASTGST